MSSTNSQIALLASNRAKILRFAFIFQFIAAIPFLWFAHATGKVHAQLLLHSNLATGTVIGSVPVHTSSNSTSYEAVVAFTPGIRPDDGPVRFQEWKAVKIAPTAGTKVTVLFDPADPEVAMVDRGSWNYLPWAPCAAIGIFLVLVAGRGLMNLLRARL